MNRLFARLSLVAICAAVTATAGAATFNLFSPASGVLKGNPSTYVTTSAAGADIIGLWTGTCSAATFLRGDGSCAAPAGTVSSVGLTAPSVFSVSGSPVTSSGTLGLTFATGQTQNQVLATPNGSTGALSLRSLVAADIPAISLTTGVSGILPGANGGTSNGFTAFSGPATTLKTFTLPNASAVVLTDNSLVTVSQGGTGAATLTGVVHGNGTSAMTAGAVVLTSEVSGILPGANGGTANGFTAFSGPATSLKTFTLPNATATILTTNAAVTVAQGGTGVATLTGIAKGNGTSAFTAAASSDVIGLWTGTCNSTTFLRADGSCQTAGGGGTPGGSNTQIQYNNSSAFGGASTFSFNNASGTVTNSQLALFSNAPSSSLDASILLQDTNNPILGFTTTSAGTNEKVWDIVAAGANLNFRTADDAGTNNVNWMVVNRTGTTVNSVTVSAPGIFTAASAVRISQVNPIQLFTKTDGGTDAKKWRLQVGTNSFGIKLLDDAESTTTDIMTVTRSGMSVSEVVFPIATFKLPNMPNINTVNNGSVCWNIAGTLSYNSSTTCLASSIRFKDHVKDLSSGLGTVMALRPVSYDYKPEFQGKFAHGNQVGLIAEEVDEVDSRLAFRNLEGEIQGVRYEQMNAILILAIQQQQHQIYILWLLLALSFGFTIYRTRTRK